VRKPSLLHRVRDLVLPILGPRERSPRASCKRGLRRGGREFNADERSLSFLGIGSLLCLRAKKGFSRTSSDDRHANNLGPCQGEVADLFEGRRVEGPKFPNFSAQSFFCLILAEVLRIVEGSELEACPGVFLERADAMLLTSPL